MSLNRIILKIELKSARLLDTCFAIKNKLVYLNNKQQQQIGTKF